MGLQPLGGITVFTLSTETPYLLNIFILKSEIVHLLPVNVSKICSMYGKNCRLIRCHQCLFEREFYSSVDTVKGMSSQSVNLFTLFLGRLSPLRSNNVLTPYNVTTRANSPVEIVFTFQMI